VTYGGKTTTEGPNIMSGINDWSDIFPDAWQDAEVIEGVDLVDKAELLGKAFLITSVEFTENAQGVNFVYVSAEDVDGTRFQFNDSSTGVRQQIAHKLTLTGRDAAIESGGQVDLRLIAPRGLRVSEYAVKDRTTGKMKTARTYYLTTVDTSAVNQPSPASKVAKVASAKKTGQAS